jgi:hypothetical protein
MFLTVLRARDVYPGSRIQLFPSSMLDPGSELFPPAFRIRIKEFKYLNPKKWFLSSGKYDLGCSYRILIRILTFYPSQIPHPGVPDPDPIHWFLGLPDPHPDPLVKSMDPALDPAPEQK